MHSHFFPTESNSIGWNRISSIGSRIHNRHVLDEIKTANMFFRIPTLNYFSSLLSYQFKRKDTRVFRIPPQDFRIGCPKVQIWGELGVQFLFIPLHYTPKIWVLGCPKSAIGCPKGTWTPLWLKPYIRKVNLIWRSIFFFPPNFSQTAMGWGHSQ